MKSPITINQVQSLTRNPEQVCVKVVRQMQIIIKGYQRLGIICCVDN